jgi:hypothetical protein
MPIVNFDFNSAGQSGENPAILYLATTDPIAEVTAAGYINGIVGSRLPVAVGDMILVNTQETPTSPEAVAWYGVTKTGTDYVLTPANSPFPVVTPEFGGTGLTTGDIVPYSLLAAGATNLDDFQFLPSLGAAGEVLTSSGAGGLPVWGTAGGSGAPVSATYITQTPNVDLPNEQAMSLLTTGLLKNTTATGVLSIATAGTDYYAPGGVIPISDGGTGATTASGARSALGLAIGVNVQAYDATLQSISALGTAADKMIYTTGIDTWAETATTSYGRSLLNLANAAAGITALGLGTISTQNANAVSITGGTITGITDIVVADGGTGASSFTAYSLIAAGTTSTGAFQNVSGVGTAGQILTSNGAGTLPTWQAAAAGGTVTSVSGTTNRITSTGGTDPIIDISAVYVGQTSLVTLGTVTTGTWSATNIALAKGGTNAALTADNGAIFYSTATAGALLASTATAGKVLQSGSSAAPTWSTPTYPSASGTSGTILRSNGTNNVYTTSTFADTYTASNLLYSNGSNAVTGLATANNGVLVTSGAGVPSISSTLPTATQSNITTLGTVTTGVWNASVIPLAYGGTNAALTADNGGIFYSTATAGAILASTATAGKMLRSGSSAAPTWSTATFPNTATGTGTILRADGTNWAASTSSYPDTNAVSTLLYASSANVMSALATVNRASLSTNSTGVPTWLALTDGQIVVGSTSGSPAAANLTAGSGITISNASNSITINAIGGGVLVTWSTVAISTSMTTLNGYVSNGAGTLTFTLPTTAAVGDTVQVLGFGAGGWTIVQNTGQNIIMSNLVTTTTTGSLSSTSRYDYVTLICCVANTTWSVQSVQGVLTVV